LEKNRRNLKIAIGLPAFNEGKNIASIIAQLKKKYALIIVCDDGSSDFTSVIAEEMGAIVIKHKKNLGYGAAIRSLFLKAQELDCDILVTFDSDGQHKISDIESVIQPIKDKQANIVIGSRFLGNIEGNIPTYRKLGIKAITNLVNSNTGNKITDSQSGFRGYDKKTLEKIIPSESGMGVSTEILIKANKHKLKII
jgi:glycosyltransferase involved in cell wall biosynthesis